MNASIKTLFALMAFLLFGGYQPAKAAIIDPIAPMDHQTYLKEIRWHGWEGERRFEIYRHDDGLKCRKHCWHDRYGQLYCRRICQKY